MYELLDFHATWCQPCKLLSVILDKVMSERPNLKLTKLDVDEEADKAKEFKIMGVPTLVLLKDGVEVDRSVGALPKAKLDDWLNKYEDLN